jgi:hypothetical protein
MMKGTKPIVILLINFLVDLEETSATWLILRHRSQFVLANCLPKSE